MIFVQRQGVTGTVPFTGDAARVTRDGVVVVDWTTGGALHDVPQGDGYTLEIRTGTTITSDALAIGVEMLALGQSNMGRWFETPAEHPPATSGGYLWSDGAWRPLTGDGALEFASVLGHDLGDVPIAFVDGSIGGSALLPQASTNGQAWLQSGPGSLYQNAIDQLDATGGRAELVIWTQGEQDAASHKVSAAQYATALTTVLQEVRRDAPGAHILINGLGPTTSVAADAAHDYWGAIRLGQEIAAAAVDDAHNVATDLELDLVGAVHLTPVSRTFQAHDLAKAALALLGHAYTGPVEVNGGAGADSLVGGDGPQIVDAGDGADTVVGGPGDDLLRGGAGDDVIHGGGGTDLISGGAGNDTLIGGVGPVELEGDAGADSLVGGASGDLLFGGDGPDTLDGTSGRDTLGGGPGDDVYLVEDAEAKVVEAADEGFDTIRSPLPLTLPANVEVLDLRVGSAGSGTGNALSNQIFAGATAAALYGLGGDDTLTGGNGDDTLTGGAGSDTLDGGASVDTAGYAGFAHEYALAVRAGAGTVSGGREGGVDTLISVENLQFLDGVLTFDTGSTAAQILRLYDSFLGRAPDAAGIQSYLRFVAAGHTFQDMAANAAASSEFHDATASLTDTQYITYVYEHSLRREPDPGGLQNYLDALHSGALTRTTMIMQAAESPEHVALTAGAVGQGLWIPDEKIESLELLYDAAVQRQPDAYGLSAYAAEVAAGTTFRQIANQMSQSPEFLAAHAGQSDAQYIESLYYAELSRGSDADGLAAYEDQLTHGFTRGDVLYETAFSQEHQSHVLAFYDPLL